jgi:hypothetical protein
MMGSEANNLEACWGGGRGNIYLGKYEMIGLHQITQMRGEVLIIECALHCGINESVKLYQ